MRQAQKKKEKDKVAIVLMLCFCVIALTSIFTVKSNIDKIKENKTDVPVSENTKTSEKNRGASKGEDDASTQASGKVPTVDSRGQSSSNSKFVHPVRSPKTSVTNPYSMDRLIYSVTLDQYMTHCGIDIEAPADAQVAAVAAGTVTAVYEDDRYGTSVEITHGGGMVTIYSNLSAAGMVETGDVVNAGQIIGGVGTTALFESLEPAHLHLEMLKDGSYVNPADYIKF